MTAMSYPQSDRFISSNFSASSASPPLGAGAIAASPPPGSVLAGSSRPRRIAWCPGPRLFAGDDEHSVRDNDRDDHDAAQIASDVSDAGSASDTGDAEAEVVSKAAAGANARKCAGFFIVGHPELKFYEYLGSVG